MDIKQLAINTIEKEALAISALANALTDDFALAANAIFAMKGRLIITGVGKSGLIGAKMAATFASTGTPSFFIHPVEAFHGDLGMIMDDDIVLVISHSGATDEVLRLVPCLEHRHIPIIAFTGNPQSLLAQYAAYHIYVGVESEACPLNLAPTSSTTATLVMGDALAIALMHLRNFRESDFAKFHPGGTLGYRLLTKVQDVMQTHPFPCVPMSMKISDAIIEISKAKIGLVIVTDADHKLLGLVTDGDVRRTMEKYHAQSFDMSVGDIMTRHPITVSQNDKIMEAEEVMRYHGLHTLIVIDQEGLPIGVLDAIKIKH